MGKTTSHRNRQPEIRRALNAAEGADFYVRALCFELPQGTADGAPPEWVPYLPAPDANGIIRGNDGREWKLQNPQGLIDGLKKDLGIYENHSDQLLAPKGEPSPALGWSAKGKFQVRADNSVWMQPDWNSLGHTKVGGRQYRYGSPTFDYSEKTGVITRLVSYGVTPDPNFSDRLALNHAQRKEPVMKVLLAALGLAETASENDAVAAVHIMKGDIARANNAANDISRFVPRADHDAMVLRATNAETALGKVKKENLDAQIDVEIKAALKAGKITPATEAYHRANCAAEGGLDRFKGFVGAAPAVAGDTGDLDKDPPEGKTKTALNAEQQTVARALGITDEQFKKANEIA